MKNIIYSILIPLLIIVTVQICLKYPMTREIFTDIENKEGIDHDEYGSASAPVLEIELIYGQPSEKIEILCNSKRVAVLDTPRVSISVPDKGVIQINNVSGEGVGIDINYNPGKLTASKVQREFTGGIQTLCIVEYNRQKAEKSK